MSERYVRCKRCDAVGREGEIPHSTVCNDLYEPPVREYIECYSEGTVAVLREELTAARAIVARLEDDRLVKKVAGRSVGYCVKLEAILAYRARVRGLVSEGEEGSDG